MSLGSLLCNSLCYLRCNLHHGSAPFPDQELSPRRGADRLIYHEMIGLADQPYGRRCGRSFRDAVDREAFNDVLFLSGQRHGLRIRLVVKGILRRSLQTSQLDLDVIAAGWRRCIVGWTSTEDSKRHLVSLLNGRHAIDIPGFPRTGPGAGGLDGGRCIGSVFLGEA